MLYQDLQHAQAFWDVRCWARARVLRRSDRLLQTRLSVEPVCLVIIHYVSSGSRQCMPQSDPGSRGHKNHGRRLFGQEKMDGFVFADHEEQSWHKPIAGHSHRARVQLLNDLAFQAAADHHRHGRPPAFDAGLRLRGLLNQPYQGLCEATRRHERHQRVPHPYGDRCYSDKFVELCLELVHGRRVHGDAGRPDRSVF